MQLTRNGVDIQVQESCYLHAGDVIRCGLGEEVVLESVILDYSTLKGSHVGKVSRDSGMVLTLMGLACHSPLSGGMRIWTGRMLGMRWLYDQGDSRGLVVVCGLSDCGHDVWKSFCASLGGMFSP